MAKDFGVSRRRTRTAYACSFVHVLCAAVFARDVPAKAHQALDEKTNAVLRANGPQEAHQRYRDLFATAGVDGLCRRPGRKSRSRFPPLTISMAIDRRFALTKGS
jgi:hypothetical protein